MLLAAFEEDDGMRMVDLAERPIAARYKGVGQINRDTRRRVP